MKFIVINTILTFISFVLYAQVDRNTACSNYRKGKFSYNDSVGNQVLVDRKKKYQYEKNQATQVKTQFRIKWNSDCQYELTLVSSNSRSLRKNKFMTSTINISRPMGDHGYEYTCACKGTDVNKTTGIMKKIKP
jgi:hypothetical protein